MTGAWESTALINSGTSSCTPYPDDLLITSGKSTQALEKELTFLLAIKLFELHRFSLGKAALLQYD
jgi:hypothetical protein